MTTTKTTIGKSTEAPPQAAKTRFYRPTVFPYQRVPTHGLQLILAAKLDGAAPIRLWLALSALSNGYSREVTISNGDLLKVARMTDPKMLRNARAALVAAKVLTATPAGGRREAYTYDLEPLKRRNGQKPKWTPWDEMATDGWNGSSWGDESDTIDVNHG